MVEALEWRGVFLELVWSEARGGGESFCDELKMILRWINVCDDGDNEVLWGVVMMVVVRRVVAVTRWTPLMVMIMKQERFQGW